MGDLVPFTSLLEGGTPPFDIAALSPDDPRLGNMARRALGALQQHGVESFHPEVAQGMLDAIRADIEGTTGFGNRLADDVLDLPESFARGVVEMPGQIADLYNLLLQGAGAGAGALGMEETGDFLMDDAQFPYGSQWLNENVSDALLGEQAPPRTGLGNVANTAARWSGNSIVPIPGMMGANRLTLPLGAAGGAVAGGLDEAGAPEWLQAVGGVGTMIGGGLAANRIAGGARLARDAMSGASPDDLSDGLMRLGQSYDQGVPLLASEALDNPGLRNLVGDILATGGRGANELQSFLSARPGQVRAAGEEAIQAISPNMTDTPIGVAQNVNETGAQIIGDARGARSAAVRPFYDAARGTPINAAPVTMMLDGIDLDLRNAVVGGQARSLIENFRNQVAGAVNENGEFTASALDSIYKHWRDLANNAMNPAAPTENQITLAAIGELRPYIDQLGDIVAQNSPIGQGRQVYQQMTPQVQAVTGSDNTPAIPQRLADAGDIDQLADALLDPEMVRTQDIAATLNAIRTSSGDVPRMMGSIQDLMRTHLQNEFDAATANLQSGERLTGGARFAANVTGNQQEAQNLSFLLREIDPEVAQGFEALMETFRRTGTTPTAGSPTAGRIDRMATAGQNVVSGVADALPVIGSGQGLLGGVSNFMRRVTQGRSYGRLASYLTSPDGIEQLRRLGRLGPYDHRAGTIIATILNAVGENAEEPAAPRLVPIGSIFGN